MKKVADAIVTLSKIDVHLDHLDLFFCDHEAGLLLDSCLKPREIFG